MKEFNVLRACFYLLAFVMIIAMAETLIGLLSCVWVIVIHEKPPESCGNIGQNVREIFSELLTSILALIAASNARKNGDK